MAVLLRSASQDDLEAAYDAYVELTRFKVASFKHDPKYTIPEIASNATESVRNLLKFDNAITITGEQDKRFKDFGGSYLPGKRTYRKTEHVTDVLLVCLFAHSLQRYLTPAASGHGDSNSRRHEVEFMHTELEKMSGLEQLGHGINRRQTGEHRQARSEIIQSIPDSFIKKKILRAARLEHISLVRALSTISSSMRSS